MRGLVECSGATTADARSLCSSSRGTRCASRGAEEEGLRGRSFDSEATTCACKMRHAPTRGRVLPLNSRPRFAFYSRGREKKGLRGKGKQEWKREGLEHLGEGVRVSVSPN